MSDMVNVTIYTTPDCGACHGAKNAMTRYGIPFTEVDTATDPAARAYVRDDLGYLSAPVTALTYRDGRVHTWGGFDLEQIRHAREVLEQEGAGVAPSAPLTHAHSDPRLDLGVSGAA